MQFTQRQINNFWNKVEKTDTCWNWTGYTNGGYGKVNINGVVYCSHRVSLAISGRLSEPLKKEKGAAGEIVMHTCDNRRCVNPDHLKATTQVENMLDAKIKGRKWNGETAGSRNGRSKLTEDIVRTLKSLFNSHSKVDMYSLASHFEVDVTQLYNIRKNKTWRHVNP